MRFSTIVKRFQNGLHIREVGDGFLYASKEHRAIGFPHKSLIVDGWNKNAVFYNLHATAFPFVKDILLLSHPCDRQVIHRFPQARWFSLGHYYFSEFPAIKHTEMTPEDAELLMQVTSGLDVYDVDVHPEKAKIWIMQKQKDTKKYKFGNF